MELPNRSADCSFFEDRRLAEHYRTPGARYCCRELVTGLYCGMCAGLNQRVRISVRGGGRALCLEVEPAIPPQALRLGLRFGAPAVEAVSSFVTGSLGVRAVRGQVHGLELRRAGRGCWSVWTDAYLETSPQMQALV